MTTLFHWLYVQAILIDGDYLNDWLTHFAPAFM
jgi:hypothetical protein